MYTSTTKQSIDYSCMQPITVDPLYSSYFVDNTLGSIVLREGFTMKRSCVRDICKCIKLGLEKQYRVTGSVPIKKTLVKLLADSVL